VHTQHAPQPSVTAGANYRVVPCTFTAADGNTHNLVDNEWVHVQKVHGQTLEVSAYRRPYQRTIGSRQHRRSMRQIGVLRHVGNVHAKRAFVGLDRRCVLLGFAAGSLLDGLSRPRQEPGGPSARHTVLQQLSAAGATVYPQLHRRAMPSLPRGNRQTRGRHNHLPIPAGRSQDGQRPELCRAKHLALCEPRRDRPRDRIAAAARRVILDHGHSALVTCSSAKVRSWVAVLQWLGQAP
jgi:hypothetical protein